MKGQQKPPSIEPHFTPLTFLNHHFTSSEGKKSSTHFSSPFPMIAGSVGFMHRESLAGNSARPLCPELTSRR